MELFGTAGIRGSAREAVTPGLALAVGRAAALAATDGAADAEVTFVLGRDGRQTGPALAHAVAAGLASGGARVERAGRLPTPALAFASRGRRGAMVTASHNPPGDNGIKLFADGREYDREAERAVAQRVEAAAPPVAWDRWAETGTADPLPGYCERVAAYAGGHGAPLEGLRVAVDCGNGTAALATPQVLRKLGAEVVALNANVDAHFPGRGSKPTTESLADLRAFVADAAGTPEAVSLGLAHDGDADRVVVVDGRGDVVHEDTVVAVLAEHYVRLSDVPDPVVVTTPNASGRIDERVADAGGRIERVRLGALHEGMAAVEIGDAEVDVVFAAEPWKHVHPALGPWIDGVASAAVFARLVAAVGLGALVSPVVERPYRKENVACADELKGAAVDRLRESLPRAFPDARVSTEHGVRLTFEDAWVLVRPSGTEPYVRIYAESDGVDDLVAAVRERVEAAVEAAG